MWTIRQSPLPLCFCTSPGYDSAAGLGHTVLPLAAAPISP